MDKFAEQINRDIYTLAMYKLANWSKIAEGESAPPSPPQQEPEPYPTNIRAMDPRMAAEAEEFEGTVYAPMLRPDIGEIDDENAQDRMTTRSPVSGVRQGMPQRYSETAMELASGMNLPRPALSRPLEERLNYPLISQHADLMYDPYGQGFADDIDAAYDKRPAPRIMADNPGQTLRRQHNYYPRPQPPRQ